MITKIKTSKKEYSSQPFVSFHFNWRKPNIQRTEQILQVKFRIGEELGK